MKFSGIFSCNSIPECQCFHFVLLFVFGDKNRCFEMFYRCITNFVKVGASRSNFKLSDCKVCTFVFSSVLRGWGGSNSYLTVHWQKVTRNLTFWRAYGFIIVRSSYVIFFYFPLYSVSVLLKISLQGFL